MNRRNFMRGAFGVAALAVSACDSNGTSPSEQPVGGLPNTADRAVFGLVETSESSLYPIGNGRALALDPRNRTVECVGTAGETCWSIADGTFSGPTHALAWKDSIAVVDRSGSVILLDDAGNVVGRLPSDGLLSSPAGAVVLADGRLAVSDTLGHRVVAFDASGAMSTILADSEGMGAVLNTPRGLAVDSAGNLHIVSGGNARVEVVTPDGQWLRSYGGTESGLASPRGIAIDDVGRAFVADPVAGAVFAFEGATMVERYVVSRDDGFAASPREVHVLADGSIRIALTGS